LRQVLTDVANELRDKGVLDEEKSFIDATFAMAKGGGAEIGPTKRGKGMKIMAIVDRHGLPLSVSTHAANHHEVRSVQLCFDFYMIEAKPETLIGDRSSPGCNGSVAFLSAGSFIRRTSLASCNSPASSSSSNDFEIGSRKNRSDTASANSRACANICPGLLNAPVGRKQMSKRPGASLGERLPVVIADDEAMPIQLWIRLLDRPGRRKAAQASRS
jgi:hypothetical protein